MANWNAEHILANAEREIARLEAANAAKDAALERTRMHLEATLADAKRQGVRLVNVEMALEDIRAALDIAAEMAEATRALSLDGVDCEAIDGGPCKHPWCEREREAARALAKWDDWKGS